MTATPTPTPGEQDRTQPPVVVGVDGSDGSRSALTWAAAEAEAAGTGLLLVCAVDDHPRRPRFPVRVRRDVANEMVGKLAAEASALAPDTQVDTRVYDGHTLPTLLDHLGDSQLLVVGKRGLGAIPRLLVGSTSLALAGRAAVPVAVVPTEWDQEAHAEQPIVLGVDPYRPADRLLEMAFSRAQRQGVPLVAVHGWEAPGAPVWTDAPLDEWEREAHEEFQKVLAGWRSRFPDVEVRQVPSSHHPAVAVLDAAEEGAQLVVLGRHETSAMTGFAFGSVTRAVLHYATVPVLVVPTGEEQARSAG